MLKKCFVHIFVLAALALPCAAQVLEPQFLELSKQEKAASQDCSQGVVYDSGVFSAGYGIGNGSGSATMVMKFDLPAGTTKLDQVCVCFVRSNVSAPSSMSFQAVVYDDDGPGGQPGTFLGSVNATASTIPIAGSGNTPFYPVNFSGSPIVLPDPSVYVGARWAGGPIVMCGDRSPVTPQRTSYGSGNGGATWTDLQTLFPDSPPRALGIRLDPTPNPSACVPDDTTLCLNNGRFKVTATFDAGVQNGQAEVVELTDETGYMWFFSANNVEVVLKVLNACTFNQRYWVYAAGLTDVRVVITVTDTQTGAVKTYINPQGRPFQPILDSSAFNTCP